MTSDQNGQGPGLIQRLIVGGIAGALATLPQSAVVWGLRRAGVYHSRPAPEQIVDDLSARSGLPPEPEKPRSGPTKAVAHFGFGAAGGAGYGLLTGLVPAHPLTGLLIGLGIWKSSYDGWLPKLGFMPPPEEDEQGRQLALILAHAAYGLALGALVQRLTAKPS